MAAITAVALATEPSSNVLYGDLTRDGAVNAADAAVLRAVIAGKRALPVALPSRRNRRVTSSTATSPGTER